MRIGVPKEVKVRENRVSCTPSGVRELVRAGHEVVVQIGAGEGAGFNDDQYVDAGATIVRDAGEAWCADMVMKVKEPVASEYIYFRSGLILFTYLHLAADHTLADALCAADVSAVGYETVQVDGKLPLLEPMSKIAGRMSTMMGCYYLSKHIGGNGVLLGGIAGVPAGNVVVIGGGAAGLSAARVASGIGANVTLLELDIERMHAIDMTFRSDIRTIYSTEAALLERLGDVDLLIGAVLIPGAKAPKLITRDMLRGIKPGAVFVDIAIDQGGCAETSRATTHDDPVYFDEGVLHYCVANMPAAYSRTATIALTNSTLPYAMLLAHRGLEDAMDQRRELRSGLNIYHGEVVHQQVAEALSQTSR